MSERRCFDFHTVNDPSPGAGWEYVPPAVVPAQGAPYRYRREDDDQLSAVAAQ
jgi:hypothetical protein